MSHILLELKEKKDLSNNEMMVAKYILAHPDRILTMSSKDLADQCFVSISTIYRLCDKLNLSGFSDLKVKISSSLESYISKIDEFNYDFPIKEHQTQLEIINILKEDYEKSLTLTNHFIDLKQLKSIISAMKKASEIDIYTSSANIFFAENFKFQMQEIGVHVNVPIEEYYQRMIASYGDETHLAIVISYEGRSTLINKIPSILKEKKTPIVLISSYEYKDSQIGADFHLYINPYENHYKKISAFSTRISILYILDILYTCYFSLDYDTNLKKKLNYYHLIEKHDK